MELDDYKTVWQEYNEKLKKNLRLNEALLRQMNLNQSRNEMRTPLMWEYLNTCVSILVILFFTVIMIRYRSETEIFITGLISITGFIYFVCSAFIKIKILTGIDYYNSPILEIQKRVLHFKQLYHKFKKIELLFSPGLLSVSLIMVFKGMHNINLIHHLPLLFGHTLGCLIIAIPLSLWIYKHCYEKKIANAYESLNNIEEFESE